MRVRHLDAALLPTLPLLALAGDRLPSARTTGRINLPPLVLWAWDRDEICAFSTCAKLASARPCPPAWSFRGRRRISPIRGCRRRRTTWVRATQFGDMDSDTPKAAYELLHGKFPHNPWTTKTPHWF